MSSTSHTMEEQAPPSRKEALADQGEVISLPLNKYGYAEFAGYDGKRYLDKVLQQVLTYATWRTWHFSDEFVAPGNDCYVGMYRLAEEVRPGIRKIEMDLKALRDLGLLRVYPDYRLVKQRDGQMHQQAVIIKDFTALYALAHEYHLWTISPHSIPPEREYVPLILADEALTHKLLRFDNYRRLLCCKKPGRKPVTGAGETPMSHGDIAALAAHNAYYTPTNTTRTETKEFSNTQDNTFSPYRESRNPYRTTSRDSFSNPTQKERSVAPMTIGKAHPSSSIEPGTDSRDEQTNHAPSNPPSPQQGEPRAAEAAKEVKGEEKPMSAQEKAAAALAHIIPAAHWQEMHQTKPTVSPSRALVPSKERPRWQTPDWLVREVALQAQDLRDDPKVLGSVITRWSKVVHTVFEVSEIETAGPMEIEMILNKIRWARKKLDRYIRKVNPKRRIPYLLECFIGSWQLAPAELLYLESDEPLYQDSHIGDFVRRLYHSYERSGSREEFDVWAQERLEREREHKKRSGA